FPPPGPRPQSPFELESTQSWRVERELVGRTAALESQSRSRYRLRDGGTVTYSHQYEASVPADQPAAVAIRVRSEVEVQRAAETIHVRTTSAFTPEAVVIDAVIERDGVQVFSRRWQSGSQ